MLSTIYWKQLHGVGRGLGSLQCQNPWISVRKEGSPYIMFRRCKDQTCKPWGDVYMGMGSPYVLSACTLSFLPTCELCRSKSCHPVSPQSSQPGAWTKEPQTAYNSPFRNLSLILLQFLKFPWAEFFWICPGHASASLCIPCLNNQDWESGMEGGICLCFCYLFSLENRTSSKLVTDTGLPWFTVRLRKLRAYILSGKCIEYSNLLIIIA